MAELIRIFTQLWPVLSPLAGLLVGWYRNRKRNPVDRTLSQAVANGTSKQIKALVEENRQLRDSKSRAEKSRDRAETERDILEVKLQAEKGEKAELRLQVRKLEGMLRRERRRGTDELRLPPGAGGDRDGSQ